MFARSTLAEIALAVTVAELIGLLAYHRLTGRGLSPSRLLPNICAGIFLMLALQAELLDAGWQWFAASLGCAGAAHLVDMAMRIQKG